jgi:hypothetical protein
LLFASRDALRTSWVFLTHRKRRSWAPSYRTSMQRACTQPTQACALAGSIILRASGSVLFSVEAVESHPDTCKSPAVLFRRWRQTIVAVADQRPATGSQNCRAPTRGRDRGIVSMSAIICIWTKIDIVGIEILGRGVDLRFHARHTSARIAVPFCDWDMVSAGQDRSATRPS